MSGGNGNEWPEEAFNTLLVPAVGWYTYEAELHRRCARSPEALEKKCPICVGVCDQVTERKKRFVRRSGHPCRHRHGSACADYRCP